MAINPIAWPTANIDSTADFAPLGKIGEIIKQQMEQNEAEKLISRLFQQSQDGQQQTPQASLMQPPRQTAPQAPPTAVPPQATAAPPVTPSSPYFRTADVGQAQWGPGQPTTAPPQGPNVGPVFPPLQTMARAAPSPMATTPTVSSPLYGQGDQPRWGSPGAGPTAPTGGFDPVEAAPQVAQASVPLPRPRPPGIPMDAMAQAPPEPMQRQAPIEYTQPGLERALDVIKRKESSGNYNNVTTTRNRAGQPQSAIGAYGVMDFNVGPWTKEVLGRELSPQEFLQSREAQDAVARAKIGQYAQKYGLTGAAKAWFAGEGGMKNPNARDALGTSVSSYASDFDRKMGGDLPPEITGGSSRPAAREPSQAMSFDEVKSRAVQNLTSPQPTQAAGITSEQLAQLYRNPITRPLAMGFLQKQLDPGKWEFMAAGDNIVRHNSVTGQYDVIPMHQKPTVVPDKASLVSSDGNVVFKGNNDEDKYGKLGNNERWKDVNDKSKGAEPIPGSSNEKLSDEVAARFGLAKSWFSTLPDLKARIERGDVGIDNPMNHAQAIAGIGVPGETQRMITSGQEALSRMLTGAGMPDVEAQRQAAQYGLTPRDTKWSAMSKVAALERHLANVGEEQGIGRGGTKLSPVPPLPPTAPPPPAAAVQETKTIGGKTYQKIGGKWFGP